MSTEQSMTRRGFLRGTAGAAGLAGASGAAAAQQDEIDSWLSDTSNYDGVTDATGQDEITVAVGAEGNGGAFAFDPPAVRIDPGTTIVWEWTGEGGQHNVRAMEGAEFESELTAEAGATFEHTFEEEGLVTYQCDPHAALGMKGAVAVGGEAGGGADTGGDGGSEGAVGPSVPDSAKTVGVATSIAMVATLGLAFFLMKYGGGRTPE